MKNVDDAVVDGVSFLLIAGHPTIVHHDTY